MTSSGKSISSETTLPTNWLANREKIRLQHQLIPKYMAGWKIDKAVAAARMKVELMMSIKDQLLTTLPSALLELYEMCRLAKVVDILFHPLLILSFRF